MILKNLHGEGTGAVDAANKEVLQMWKLQQRYGLIPHRLQHSHQSGSCLQFDFICFSSKSLNLVVSFASNSVVDSIEPLQHGNRFIFSSFGQKKLWTLREKEERDSCQKSGNRVQDEQQSPRLVGD